MFKLIVISIFFYFKDVTAKYVEGELNTRDNWAFLARFCFLSDEGQFEYDIEYSEDQGDLNLLLYYDTEDQWPSVYKSNKTCEQREHVLNKGLNQIVNLTRRDAFSGCKYLPVTTTPIPHYTLNIPTPSRKSSTTKKILNKTKLQVTKVPTTTTTLSYETTTFAFSSVQSTEFLTTDETSSTDIYSTKDTLHSTNAAYSTSIVTEPSNIITAKPAKVKRSVPKPQFTKLRYGNRMIMCHHARRFRSARERWWFIAVSNCNATRGIHIKYKLFMTNGAPGDYWHEHFSADEFYILPVLMAFSIAYSFIMLGIVMCSIELKSRQLLHTTYKIFVFSVILQLFGIMVESIVYLKYAMTGLQSLGVRRFAVMLMGASETLFLLQLLLLAKGFTITRGRLPLKASIKLTVFMCLYVVTYISIFIYEAKVFDPGEVLYLYESPAGYGLIILRIIAWCMFVYSTIFTLKHYPEKSNFYYPFNLFGTLWFIAGPAFIISANIYIDKWVRESVVCAVLLFISFGGHLMFLILTMPSVANKNFPYHVRTTQIGVMEITGNAGSSTIEQFGHHAYEPTTTIRQQTVIVPLSRRTEEIFEGMYNQQAFKRNGSNGHVENEIDYLRDSAVENILNWSLVKNIPSLEIPNFERSRKDSISSRHSGESADDSLDSTLRPNHSHLEPQEPEQPANTFDDYIREVPIELFTISKMVIETKHNTNNQNDNQGSSNT